MIERFVAATRRVKAVSPELEAIYRKAYGAFGIDRRVPLHVVYSSACRAELVSLGGANYIIYDQALGACFNLLNRTLAARSAHADLSRHFACRYLGRRLLDAGRFETALLVAAAGGMFRARAFEAGDPYDDGEGALAYRSALTFVQELAVLSHEVSHFIFSVAGGSVAIRDAARESLVDFLRERIAARTDYRGIQARYGKKVAKEMRSSPGEHKKIYQRVLDNVSDRLVEEVGCDEMGALLLLKVVRALRNDVSPDVVVKGVVLAYRYSRLLSQLELIFEEVVRVEQVGSENVVSRIVECAWDSNGMKLVESQVREHLLRSRVLRLAHELGVDTRRVHAEISDALDRYDELIEFPCLIDLPKRLNELLKGERPPIKGGESELISFVNRATGW